MAKKQLHTSNVKNAIPKFADKIPQSLFIAACLIILLRFAASYFPNDRIWGLNHIAYIGDTFKIIFTLLCLVFLLPTFFKIIVKTKLFEEKKKHSLKLRIVVAVILMFIIWFFPVKGFFLGDGFSYSAELFRYLRHAPYNPWLLFSSAGSAPITGYIYTAVTIAYLNVATWLLNIKAMELIMTTSWLICGMICSIFLVFGIFRFSKFLHQEYEKSNGVELSLIGFFVFIPGTVFFFGYVEYYLFAYITAFFFIISSLNYIFRRKTLILPIVLFILTTAFHISGLILLPALLYLFTINKVDWNSLTLNKLYLSYLTLIILTGILYYGIFGSGETSNRFLISLLPYQTSAGTQSYSLLSSYNMIDNLNLVLFLAFIPTVLSIYYFMTKKKNNTIFLPDPTKNHTIAKAFTIILSISFFVLLLYGNSGFGKARDWDIYAAIGLALSSFAILLFQQVKKEYQRYITYSTFIVALNGFIPWMYVNLSEHASENYFRSIMQLDEKHILSDYALNGYEHLRKAYYSRGEDEQTVWALKKKIELVGYPLDFHEAMIIMQKQDSAHKRNLIVFLASRVTDLLERMKNEHVDSLHAGSKKIFLDLAGEILFTMSKDLDKDLAFQTANKMKSFAPDAPQLRIPEAEQLHADDPKYLEIYSAISKVNFTSAGLAYYCGLTFLLNKKTDDALSQLLFSQQLDPNYFNAKYLLGIAYLNKRDTTQAKKYLEDFLRSETNKASSLVKSAQNYLQRIQH